MKKFLMILLAIMLVMVNVAALAEDDQTIPDPDISNVTKGDTKAEGEATTPSIGKTYTTTGGTIYPTETLTFAVTKKADTYPEITVGTNNTFEVAGGTTATYTIPVNVPAATAYEELGAGRYHYTVTETGASTTSQAVVYSDKVFNVDIYAFYDDDKNFIIEPVIYSGEESTAETISTKNDSFENKYSVGELKISKIISGNLADPDKEFTIKVTLTSTENVASALTFSRDLGTGESGDTAANWTDKKKEITIKLKGGQDFTISNIPTGVTYKVEETGITNITAEEQMENANDPDAYTISYEGDTGTISDKAAAAAKVTNTKGITVPTGIALDTVPYVLMLALALFGLVKLIARKREEY